MLADARAAWPQLLTRPAEPRCDRAALLQLARWCGRYGPQRNRDIGMAARCSASSGAIDHGLWIDITGVAHLYGGEARLLEDLSARLAGFGLTARAALADTLGGAHALARFGPGPGSWTLAPEGELRAMLAGLPVEGLRLMPKTALLLKRLGLRRIGQLYDLPRPALARRFRASSTTGRTSADEEAASAVLLRLDEALGLKPEPRRALGEPFMLSVRRSAPEPIISAEALNFEMTALAADLCAGLDRAGLGGRRIGLSLYRADGTMAEAQVGTSFPCRAPEHLMRLLDERLARIDMGFGVDLIELKVLSAERLQARQTVLSAGLEGKAHDASALLTDRLANRLGAGRVLRLEPHASHIPERAERRVVALAAGPPAGTPAAIAAWGPGRPQVRPAVLLARAEPIRVVAEVPDGPPARFIWRRVTQQVVRAEGPERLAPEWWLELEAPGEAGEASAVESGLPGEIVRPGKGRPRDYYRVEAASGACYWVFRDGLYGQGSAGEKAGREEEGEPPRWFLHGLFG